MNATTNWVFRICEPGKAPREIPVSTGLGFGRHPSNLCALDDPKSSAYHAQIVEEEGKLFLQDRGSTNKTKVVDGPALAKEEKVILAPGLRFQIGSTTIELIDPNAKRESAQSFEPGMTLQQSIVGEAAKKEAKRPEGIQYGEFKLGPAAGTILGKNIQLDGLAKEAAFRSARPRLVLCNEADRRIVDLDSPDYLIGRVASEDPEFRIRCIIPHGSISSQHARISFNGQRFFIEDLGSKNGTFINGEMLAPGAARELRPESVLRLGSVDTVFVVDRDSEGKSVSESQINAALDVLVARNVLTKNQRERAEKEAAEKKRHPGEVLLASGILSADRWQEAMSRGEVLKVAQKAKGGASRSFYLLLLTVAILVLGGALYYLWTQIEKMQTGAGR